MSFIIAMSDNENISMAADTKVTSVSGLFNHPNIHKIHTINSNCMIGITGMSKFGEQMISHLSTCFEYCRFPNEIVNCVENNVKEEVQLWVDNMGVLPDCTLLVVGVDKNRVPYFSMITINGNDIKIFERSFACGKYHFLFASPNDYPFSDCNKLCYKIIGESANSSLDLILRHIVFSVSTISKVVNDEVDILTIALQGI